MKTALNSISFCPLEDAEDADSSAHRRSAMSFNKRKIFVSDTSDKRKIFVSDTSDEDDSFKYQRSSLRVNLSHSDNLTDSGNGSLWRTEIENDERRMDGLQTFRRSSRDKGTYKKNYSDGKNMQAESDTKTYTTNNDSEMSVQVKEGIHLKSPMVNLEDISTKECYLETNCKRLKDAILCKTEQIFDRKNEFSMKTTMVLENRKNHFASNTHDPNTGNKTVMLDITDRQLKEKTAGEHEQYANILDNRQKKNQYFNIVATPLKSDGRRSLERTVDKSRLTQRRLFVEKEQIEGQTKCRIIEDIILKKKLPFSVRQANQSNSPILSGSNRRLSLFRARSKLRSQKFESLNNTYSTVHSIQNIDIGMPVGCSTFIEDNAMADKGINNVDASRAICTTNEVISMEMTEVHGGIRISKENRNSNANNCNGSSKEQRSEEGNKERNKSAASLKVIEHPKNKITVQNNTLHFDLPYTDDVNQAAGIDVDTVISMQESTEEATAVTKTRDVLQAHECDSKTNRNERRCTISLSDSSDTIRSSLNVNTSLDTMTKTRNIQRSSINHRMNDIDQDFEATINDKKSIISNVQHESTNTIRTSLQMNTSVDSVRKTWQRRNNKDNKDHNHSTMEYSSITENKNTDNINFLENISLIERLRNISVRNQVSHDDKSRIFKTKDEDKRHSNNSRDSYSYVEGTPYPISRSVLFKSQLKYKTQHLDDAATCSGNLNSMDDEMKNDKTKSVVLHSKVSNKMHMLIGTQKIIESNTVTLEDTPSDNPFMTQNQLTVIEDTSIGTKCETNKKNIVQNAECAPVRKGRRRLLPLNENSQCSISPVVEKGKCTPEEFTSTAAKRKERLKKRLPKKKSMHSKKKNTSDVKQDVTNKRMWSDSDCDIPENKKKEDKKTRKPKKIISKKIFIKKFVDENVLNILQKNRQNKEDHLENDDSLDDFVKCHTISTQWNKYKSQKIVIVTTGLSKGDKSLVKSIVRSLGVAEMELNVSRRTTHVVSTGVRTVNLLRGIIRGCWLVTLEWVLKSLENNAWLDPETFEIKHFSKAVQVQHRHICEIDENRRDRQLFGSSYIPELFTTCGFIYVERKTVMPCDTLKELIRTAGGHITENVKLAKIIIGANGLKETWVIDSITTGELQLTKFYQRT